MLDGEQTQQNYSAQRSPKRPHESPRFEDTPVAFPVRSRRRLHSGTTTYFSAAAVGLARPLWKSSQIMLSMVVKTLISLPGRKVRGPYMTQVTRVAVLPSGTRTKSAVLWPSKGLR